MTVFVDQKALLVNIVTSALWMRIIRTFPHMLIARHESENELTAVRYFRSSFFSLPRKQLVPMCRLVQPLSQRVTGRFHSLQPTLHLRLTV
jgi:hypothetical protein